MICISLADISFEECLEAVRKCEFAELRLDLLSLSNEQVRQIFSSNTNLIATCRPGSLSEEERKTRLLTAIGAGAAYVDVEMDSGDAFKNDIINAAQAKGSKVIVSYNNFEKTPQRAELEHILTWCEEFDSDIVKIACMVNDKRDNARLLGLLDHERAMIVVGMGEKGKITRVVAPLLGSFCTFAPYASGKATGPGQLSINELEMLINEMKQV